MRRGKVNIKVNRVCVLACVLSVLGAIASIAADEESSPKVQRVLQRLREGSNGKTPTVKEFTAAWAASLDQRGQPTVYTRENSKDFEYIGMPVGGIGAGLLYLGGDGKLWGWDLFNTKGSGQCRGEHGYKNPYTRSDTDNPAYYALNQGFAVRFEQDGVLKTKTLDRDGFQDIRFRGEYPVGFVTYADKGCPVQMQLTAFSPFCPLNLKDSTYPATVLIYTVKNTSDKLVSGEVLGWLQNAVCIESGKQKPDDIVRENHVIQDKGMTLIDFTATNKKAPGQADVRPLIVFDDFEKEKYAGWTVTGTAFGDRPMPKSVLPGYMSNVNMQGNRAIISHNARQGGGSGEGDAHLGTMRSPEFTIDRKLIRFMIGGGDHPGKTCINLLVDGKAVRTGTGKNNNAMRTETFDVSNLHGKKARLEIVDQESGGWGNISIDDIVLCDAISEEKDMGDWLKNQHDYGSMALALVSPKAKARASAYFQSPDGTVSAEAQSAKRLCKDPAPVGALARTFQLKPGETVTARFVLSWYFPRYRREPLRTSTDRSYGDRFADARAVAETVATRLDTLASQTLLWNKTWYDSTLPYWFLDRTFINTDILASNTSYIFSGGRFFGYEGEYLGHGTCTHVWGYVQAMGRLFPALERSLREQVEYNPKVGFDNKTGGIGQRAEQCPDPAEDGQCSVILRTLLTHQMQPDNKFLNGIYPQMKMAMNFLVNSQDPDRIGMMTKAQMCTLDARWYGKIPWLSLYYQAALRAAAEMADDMGEPDVAKEWREIASRGRKYIEDNLFNGEYFIHVADPAHPTSPGSFNGCEIDQLLGQSWAYQVGLGTVINPAKATRALDSLWRYNLTTDVGPYREMFTKGRWYAMPGEGGLLMCSWPNEGTEVMSRGSQRYAGYLNECMPGFEYALSSLMMWHGMPYRSLAHTRTMHERFHGSRRNPWNEVEWGSFYSRSMASYGVFTAACGFEYDGPKAHIGFAPRFAPENFKAPFTSAEGWGSFTQVRSGKIQRELIEVKWGELGVQSLTFDLPVGAVAKRVSVIAEGRSVRPKDIRQDGTRVHIALPEKIKLKSGQEVKIEMRWN